ncbi:vWA domain-containing protein [Nitratiruptor sp. SB155-2]|uniref:vWA domain-containing protein n=1 Tax=Nitratiruptor sp. (strain SB155-2) TaxID=387092 RepID=UPI0001586EC1|nr:VWA domain-containing protein [Nitratiruptor sp. SB155-2]BAF69517.1 von Willebrand factor type A domain protein [Nitratiruptor sp. SB155-2]
MSSFAFDRPLWLWAIFIVVFCIWKCRAKESALIFPHIDILKKAANKKAFLPEFLKITAIIGTLFALAGPVHIDNMVHLKKKGYDIVLAIDASGSMQEKGFDPTDPQKTKFDVVRSLVKAFISKRRNDNIGVVIFGSFAYIASPLTFNKEAVKKILDYLDIGVAGSKTAIDDALIESVRLLKESQAKSKIVILLTDGIDTASKTPPDVAVKMAKKYGVKIYTIGIGDKRGIDEAFLRWLAQQGHGYYFYAKDASMLRKIYDEINRLEPSEIRGKEIVKKDELYPYVLFVAILALLGYIYIYGKRGF